MPRQIISNFCVNIDPDRDRLVGSGKEYGFESRMVKIYEVAWSLMAVGLEDDGDPDGIRIRIPTVKGWCPNR